MIWVKIENGIMAGSLLELRQCFLYVQILQFKQVCGST